MKQTIFTPLKNGAFRTLFTAQMFSDTGSWFDIIALNLLVSYHWGMGIYANAAIDLAVAIPWVFCGPLLGVWADRLPRKQVMLLCTTMRMAIVTGFIFAPNLPVLLGLVMAKTIFASLFEPARQGLFRQVVPENELAEAAALSQMCANATKILGPTVGGVLMAMASPKVVFLTEIVLFGISTLFLLLLPHVKPVRAEAAGKEAEKNFWRELKEGFSHIKGNRILVVSISLAALNFFFVFLYDAFYAPLTMELGLGQVGYGLMVSAFGLGAVLGALSIGHFTGWKHNPLFLICLSLIIAGGLIGLIGLGGMGIIKAGAAFWCAVCLIVGILGAGTSVPFGYILQSETPPELMGRVFSVSNAMQGSMLLVAPMLGVAFGHWLGIGAVFAFSGVMLMLIGLVYMIYTKKSKVRPTTA
jgi:MFS family permease